MSIENVHFQMQAKSASHPSSPPLSWCDPPGLNHIYIITPCSNEYCDSNEYGDDGDDDDVQCPQPPMVILMLRALAENPSLVHLDLSQWKFEVIIIIITTIIIFMT